MTWLYYYFILFPYLVLLATFVIGKFDGNVFVTDAIKFALFYVLLLPITLPLSIYFWAIDGKVKNK